LVIGFLSLLAMAFWKRSVILGLVVLTTGSTMKVIWSIYFGGEVGYAAIVPTIVTVIICNASVYLYWRLNRKQQLSVQISDNTKME